ncbi:F-box/kelch-repeat protein [Panicum miliaceum]|uniref:F-box/kelch-repeat protein n=1 Tax=Panicum miliaceum TaxID=4540 RepID=A0A3L6RS58_PANMI|nr:F-box/kelch-repeat protein [Panicum miliaceum]
MYLCYCHVGDEKWSQVDVMFEVYCDVFNGAVAFHGGKIYAATNGSYSMVVDTIVPAPAAPLVERTDIKIPRPFPSHQRTRSYLVATATPVEGGGGKLYFVRPYIFGIPDEVVIVDVCRWDPSQGAWRRVDDIGDMTLFIGGNRLAVSPVIETGTESNSIHILWSRNDGVRIFTFSLHDMTMRCSFVGIEEDEEDCDGPAQCSVPSNNNQPSALQHRRLQPCSNTTGAQHTKAVQHKRFKFGLPRQAGSSKGDGQSAARELTLFLLRARSVTEREWDFIYFHGGRARWHLVRLVLVLGVLVPVSQNASCRMFLGDGNSCFAGSGSKFAGGGNERVRHELRCRRPGV